MQAHQTSAEATDAAARVALAAAHAGMGPAQQAQEDARAQRLRHTIMDDMSSAIGDSRLSLLPEGSSSGPESSENSFSRRATIIAPSLCRLPKGQVGTPWQLTAEYVGSDGRRALYSFLTFDSCEQSA